MLQWKNISADNYISLEANIQVQTTTSDDDDDDGDDTVLVELTMKSGNVFHPEAQLLFLVNSSITEPIQVSIGNDNLFEERCQVTIDLTQLESSSSKEEDGTWLMIGSNNRFSPSCHVETSCIGNSNIFEASCLVRRKSPIGSGNVIAPLVQIMMMEQANDDETLLENTVIYNLGDNLHPQFRQEQDNDIIQLNTLENKRLLKHAQIVLKEHHTLMSF